MKKLCKTILPIFLVVIILFGAMPIGASAASPDISIEPSGGGDSGSSESISIGSSSSGPDIAITPGDSSLAPESATTSVPPDSSTGESSAPDSSSEEPAAADENGDTEEENSAGSWEGASVILENGGGGMRTFGLLQAQSTGTLHITKVNAYQWDFGFSHGASEMRPWYIMDIDGRIAYCVEPINPETNPGSYQTQDYNALSGSQRFAIGHAMLYGSQDGSNPLFHMATQTIIWEIVLGYMDLTTLTTVNKTAYNATIGYNPGAAGYYDSIITSMRNHMQVPSFTRFVEIFAPLHNVPGVAGEYKLDLVNTNPNCSLADFDFPNSGTVKFVKENEILHVTSTAPLDGNTTYRGLRGDMNSLDSLIFWGSGGDQIRATGHLDPVPAYFRLITENIGQYSITVVKLEAGTNSPLAGAEFEVRHSEKGVVGTYTTDGSGRLTVSVPWQGTYILTEITPPKNHLLDANPVKDIVISTEHPSATVTFHNESFSGIQITKVDGTTKQRIPGVTFRIARKGGGEYQDVVTGSSGIASLPNLTPDWYSIQEISCPPGYILDSQIRTVEVKSGEVCAITIENYAKPSLEIRKVDEQTGKPLAGASFRIAKKGSLEYQDIVSGPDGIARLTGMVPDYYTITEIKAPDGYILNSQPQTVEIVAGKMTTVTITNGKKPSLEILKVDSITKQPLQYATFKIGYKNGETIGTFTSDINGRVFLNAIAPGLLVVEEITAPDGYIVSNSPMEVLLKAGEAKSVTFENVPKSPVIIKKIDSVIGEPLTGAKFRVTKMNGELVGEYTTGRYGYVTVPEMSPGWYTVVELRAPDGYKLNDAPMNVEIKLNGDPAIVEMENTALPGLLLIKEDAVTGERLAGVEFEFSKLNGERIGTFTTGENGTIFLESVTEKYIVVRETKTLPSYKIDTKEQTVTLEQGKLNKVVFTNTPLPSLKLRKIDSVTGKPMAGVEFEVCKQNGDKIGTFTTDEQGFILVEYIDADAVVVRETKTLPGYRIDTAEQKVKLEPGKTAEVTFTNSPWPYLIILKVDEATKEPIPDTEFKLMDLTGKEIGTFKTNAQGKIVLTGMDAGTYKLQETKAAPAYVLDDTVWEIKLEWGKTTTVTFKNTPLKIEVEVNKRGPVEAIAGQEIQYDFSEITNKSTVPLDDFYWRDLLPTDAVRLVSIVTGTWNQDLTYQVVYRTNLKDNWVVLPGAEKLITSVNHKLECSQQVLGLASNEYVTEFKFLFGRVKPGFHEVKAPSVICRVLADLPNEYTFTNRTDVGGRYGDKWTYDRDSWTTVIYKTPESKGRLPKTGVWI